MLSVILIDTLVDSNDICISSNEDKKLLEINLMHEFSDIVYIEILSTKFYSLEKNLIF